MKKSELKSLVKEVLNEAAAPPMKDAKAASEGLDTAYSYLLRSSTYFRKNGYQNFGNQLRDVMKHLDEVMQKIEANTISNKFDS